MEVSGVQRTQEFKDQGQEAWQKHHSRPFDRVGFLVCTFVEQDYRDCNKKLTCNRDFPYGTDNRWTTDGRTDTDTYLVLKANSAFMR